MTREKESDDVTHVTRILILAGTAAICLTTSGAAQSDKQGVLYRAPGGTTLRLLLDDSNVGADVSMAEMTFPPNLDSPEHTHGAIETFYVVSGELEHVVNNKSEILKPGMAGYVKPRDKVRHKTGAAGAKVVAIWVPGAEAKRIVARWTREP